MGLVENFKDLFKLAGAANNLDLYKNLSELQTRVMELEEENNRLRTDKKDLEEKLRLAERMTFKEPFYYQDGDETPFCPSCWECKNSAAHVIFRYNRPNEICWDCPVCKTVYQVKKDRSVKDPARSFNLHT